MDRRQIEGHFITDEELLAALDDSDFEFDDLDDDPDFLIENDPINEGEVSDTSEESQDAERQDENNFNIESSLVGASQDEPLDHSNSTTGRGRGSRGRGRTRGRGTGQHQRVARGQRRGRGRERGGRQPRAVAEWTGINLNDDFPEFNPPQEHLPDRDNWDPLSYFNEYFDQETFKLMVEKTNIYYHIKNGKELKLTLDEVKKFIGISMLMSTLGYPRIRLYWDSIFKIPIVSKAMPRDRYFAMRAAIHVVNDNDVTAESKAQDRLWKVRPLINKFRDAVLKIPREQNASIDEQMIPFTGHVGFRQFVPRKPNPTGLKNYVLSSKDGLVLDFEVYQGKETTRLPPEVNERLKLGTGGRAVLRLSETCPPGTNLYFDRYFTGLALLEALKLKGISGTGTTMKQRFPNMNLKSDHDLTNEGRGACDEKIRDDQNVLAVKWVDNKVITMASTRHRAEPFSVARRYSRADRQYIEVQMPNIVRQYNINMGGVDLHNRMISHYRSYHRTNKWTVRFMEHFFDMACVNSWITYKGDCLMKDVPKRDIMDLHLFKMRLAQLLIIGRTKRALSESDTDSEEEMAPPRKRQAGRPGKVSLPLPNQRTKEALHLPQAMDVCNAPRCRNPGCSGRSRVMCVSCKVFLCVLKDRNCFLAFHK